MHRFSRFVGYGSVSSDKKRLIDRLPSLTEDNLNTLGQKDSCCPICLNSFAVILEAEVIALAMETPALWALGVTQLGCGHIFCRKDITTWILENDTCPTCRQSCAASGTTTPTIYTTLNTDERYTEVESVSIVLDYLHPTDFEILRDHQHTPGLLTAGYSSSPFNWLTDADEAWRIRHWIDSLSPPERPLNFRQRTLAQIKKVTRRLIRLW
ncbi:hypothetical protein ACEPAG_6478 [Sanghuangporus baumii]